MTSEAPQTTDITAAMDSIAAATERLIGSAQALSEAEVTAPSLLAGWTRGHLLTHLSRNADALVNLLLWARTGIETPMYASMLLRDSDIEAGAPRPLAEQLDDLRTSADRWLALARNAPAESWQAHIRTRQGREITADEILWMRTREVEMHHVDLAVGYRPADWPVEFVARLLPEITGYLSKSVEGPAFAVEATDTGFTATLGAGEPDRTVSGPARPLLAWLAGRSPGTDLTGELPAVPRWL